MKNHSSLDFSWILEDALSAEDRKKIMSLLGFRSDFVRFGKNQNSEEEIIIGTKNGTFSTSPVGHYSFLRLYEEIFKNREHMKNDKFCVASSSILDIGACEGLYSIAMATNNKKLKVIAYEPNPIAYKRMLRNIELNDLGERIKGYNSAVSSSSNGVEIVAIPEVSNISSVSNISEKSPWLDSDNAILFKCRSTTLDQILNKFKDLNFEIVKIDVEGSEVDIFNNSDFCKQVGRIKKVNIECHSKRAREIVCNFFNNLGYTLLLEDIDFNKNFEYLGNLYFLKK